MNLIKTQTSGEQQKYNAFPPWKRFKDINVVDIRYAPANYRDWIPVPSGLAGPVKLVSF